MLFLKKEKKQTKPNTKMKNINIKMYKKYQKMAVYIVLGICATIKYCETIDFVFASFSQLFAICSDVFRLTLMNRYISLFNVVYNLIILT